MIRPLQHAEHPQLTRLIEAAAPSHRFADPHSQSTAWTTTPSGDEEHLLGQWEAGHLVAALRLHTLRRLRTRHTGAVGLITLPNQEVDELVAAGVAIADDWSPLDRLETHLPADHSALAALRRHGFEDEVTRRTRSADGADNILLGRLRPGFQPRPPGPPPPWPDRPHRPRVEATIRPTVEADVPDIRDLSTAPSTVWGTLQTHSSNDAFFLRRFRQTPPGHLILVVEVQGRVVGFGGLHPSSEPGVMGLGMALDPAWQGCGLGRRMIETQLATARARGVRRVELSVWEDNTRARRLYETSGFVAEGRRRFDGIRAGGHASSNDMAVIF